MLSPTATTLVAVAFHLQPSVYPELSHSRKDEDIISVPCRACSALHRSPGSALLVVAVAMPQTRYCYPSLPPIRTAITHFRQLPVLLLVLDLPVFLPWISPQYRQRPFRSARERRMPALCSRGAGHRSLLGGHDFECSLCGSYGCNDLGCIPFRLA